MSGILDIITQFCDDRVKREEIPDFTGSENGLQIANNGDVTKIGASVDAGLNPFHLQPCLLLAHERDQGHAALDVDERDLVAALGHQRFHRLELAALASILIPKEQVQALHLFVHPQQQVVVVDAMDGQDVGFMQS